MLTNVGGKLGLVKIITESPTSTTIAKVRTVTCTLADLAGEVKREEVQALAEMPAEMSVPLDKVFETAGVKAPAHGWTVDKLAELVGKEPYKSMSRAQVQKAVLELLAKDKAAIEEVVKDAMARDRAIDAFENFVQGKLDKRKETRLLTIASIDGQIQSLQKQAEKLRQEGKSDEQQWKDWHARKVAYEKQMIHAVKFFVDSPPVTTDAD